MYSESCDLLNFGKCDNFWETVQWQTNRKSYVNYRMAPLVEMLLNDLEDYFCSLKPLELIYM